jgi:hypothetical protein
MKYSPILAVGLVTLALCAGCKKDPLKMTTSEANAFGSATPEIKQLWDAALEADKTNGYMTAEVCLYNIFRPEATEEQKSAAGKKLAEIHQRLLALVEKGDADAKAALQEMQKNPPNRQRLGGGQ